MLRYEVTYRCHDGERDIHRWDIAIEGGTLTLPSDGYVMNASSLGGAGIEPTSIKFRFHGGVPDEYSLDEGITWHEPDEVRRDGEVIELQERISPGLQKLRKVSTLVGERDGLLRQVEELNRELARMAERLRVAGLESPVEVVVRVSGRRLDL